MKEIDYTSQFKRDAKKHLLSLLTPEWNEVINYLLNDRMLPEKYKDHPLKGNLRSYRDCHVKPDLVLLYKVTDRSLTLVRLGSHSELDIS